MGNNLQNLDINWSSKTILVVEDDRFNAIILTSFIEKTKARCKIANNGEEAISLALSLKPDIILMDIKMPGITGFEAASRIKRELPHTIVIAQTAFATEFDKETILNSGFDDFIAKPIRFDKLISVLAKFM